jgi:hypothetical protein
MIFGNTVFSFNINENLQCVNFTDGTVKLCDNITILSDTVIRLTTGSTNTDITLDLTMTTYSTLQIIFYDLTGNLAILIDAGIVDDISVGINKIRIIHNDGRIFQTLDTENFSARVIKSACTPP